MYRAYEDPWKLEEQLKEAKEDLANDPEDIDLYLRVEELKERVNFAWQDQEYDEDYAREEYGYGY